MAYGYIVIDTGQVRRYSERFIMDFCPDIKQEYRLTYATVIFAEWVEEEMIVGRGRERIYYIPYLPVINGSPVQ